MPLPLSSSLSSCWSCRVPSSFWPIVRKDTCVFDTSTVLWRRWNKESHTHSPTVCNCCNVWKCEVFCSGPLYLFSFSYFCLCNSYSDGNMRQIFGSLKCALAEVLVGRVSIVCKLSSRLFPPTYSATSTFHGNCLTCNPNSFNPS